MKSLTKGQLNRMNLHETLRRQKLKLNRKINGNDLQQLQVKN